MRITHFSDWVALVSQSLMLACAFVLGSSLPFGLVILLILIGLLRWCWLEDNLHSDLLPATTLPTGYLNRLIERAYWRWWLTGLPPTPHPCPKKLACLLRQQTWTLQAMLLGLFCGFLVTHAPHLALLAPVFAWLALLRLETVIATQRHILVTNKPLPFHLVAGRNPLFISLGLLPPARKPDHWDD
jgi:hypothetical protein